MKRAFRLAAVGVGSLGLLLSLVALVSGADGNSVTLRGFSPAQAEREQKLQRIPDAESAESYLRRLTAQPHLAGTEASHRQAEYLREQFRSFGFQSNLVSYKVWLPLPVEVKLELIQPEEKKLATPEKPFEWDKDSYDRRAVVGFNGYSPSGDVTGQVVYVNYGTPADYQQLEELGVSAEGKIAIARYGRCYRGVKAQVAQEHKAAGLLIYSDPADDGYVVGDLYPRGPFRPMTGIQRGSILYTSIYPGDPLTPGVAATEQAHRLDPDQAKNLPHIPTMPLSAQDAAEILKYLGGSRVPRGWQGGLPFSYHVGPGQTMVHIALKMDFEERTLWDVISRLPGTNDNDWVVLGNHHDAWVFGAVDPSSGTAVMLETARALGELAREGWKPKRTIVMCEWDGEEPGLLGSTEWVEEHLAELQRKAVAYLNVDVGVSGNRFGGSATPSLKQLVREATQAVMDPRAGRSVYEVWKEQVARGEGRRPTTPGSEPPPVPQGDVPLGSLGAGSDFCPFFDHAGIPAMDMGFGGEYGVYHDLYDDFFWMKHFGDPSFAYHATMARIVGVIALRLADADVLPFDYNAYAAEVGHYVGRLETVAKADGGSPVDWKNISDAATAFSEAASRAMNAVSSLAADPPDPARDEKVNRALVQVEEALLAPQGLEGRPWYKHTIYAPGMYTGYGAVIMPGVREALDRQDWSTAAREASAVAEALRRAAGKLDEVARLAGASAKAGAP